MKISHLIIIIFLSLVPSFVSAQDGSVKDMRRYVKRGNRLLHSGQRDKAYEQYKKAYQTDSLNSLVNYNLGTSMFPEEWKIMKPDVKQDSVMQGLFLKAAGNNVEENPVRRGMSCHNMGVMHQVRASQSSNDQQKFEELKQAVECYKQALRNNPHDDEARYNLVLCQKQLPKGGGNNNEGNNQNDQENKEKEQKDQQQKNQEQQNQQQEQNQQPPQEQNQEWIEQLLNAAEQKEKQTRRNIDERRQNSNQPRRNSKNW